MLSNYFTFHHIAQELNKRYAGAVIAEVYSQEKNTLCIVLYTPEPHTVTISCVARKNFIIAREGESRARKNSVDLFPSLIDAHVQSAYIDAQDRIVYVRTTDGRFILVEMFGGRANVVVCDEGGVITDAFLAKKELPGSQRTLQYEPIMLTPEQFFPAKEFFHTAFASGETTYRTLKNVVPKIGSTLAEEILFRAGIAKELMPLSQKQIDAIYTNVRIVIEHLLQPTERLAPVVYFNEQTPVTFSLIPLQQHAALRMESYDSIFTALQKLLSYGKSAESFSQQKKQVVHWIEHERTKAERTIKAVERELSESSRAEEYELSGKLLMANLSEVTKGMKSVRLENSFSGNETVVITLDPSLPPSRNAERYFDKAKRAKTAHQETLERLIVLRKRFESLSELMETAHDASTGISLKNFLHLHHEQLRELGYMTEKEQEELPPFKIFTVDGGFKVYAGKSSENNDLLTVKFAKPHDLWFHARGSSGSHVVLKIGSGKGDPSKKAIEQAASIAAYYSKMKTARHVPVAMAEKKYVRKPKGVPAGTVVIEKEKVIFVKPGLPGNE
ncbi:MAG: NFACT family protein [Ignavibacteriales bacterium]|nr:NFACT family protein [Ignavibacteriales bacterium]